MDLRPSPCCQQRWGALEPNSQLCLPSEADVVSLCAPGDFGEQGDLRALSMLRFLKINCGKMYLTYNVVLISSVQQSDSVIHLYM